MCGVNSMDKTARELKLVITHCSDCPNRSSNTIELGAGAYRIEHSCSVKGLVIPKVEGSPIPDWCPLGGLGDGRY